MFLDYERIIKERLAAGFGLDRYGQVLDCWGKSNDITDDTAFQKAFNAYYRVRRNEDWRKKYYALFQRAKTEKLSFEIIIRELYKETKRIEASFASKMLATIDPNEPIWDQFVLKNLGHKTPTGKDDERLQKSIELYSEIETWYKDYMNSPEGKALIAAFNTALPDYQEITPTKKIDCFLWGNREQDGTDEEGGAR